MRSCLLPAVCLLAWTHLGRASRVTPALHEGHPRNTDRSTGAVLDGSDDTSLTAGSSQPHLMLVVADDVGWNDVGWHDARVQTPHLNALAQSGVILDRHYVYRYCSPTRGSLLSGRFPHHDHQSNPGGESAFGPNTNMTLLPQKLREVGYRTMMRGKWHYGFSRPEYLPHSRGFDDAAGYLQGACDHLTEATGCGVDSWHGNASVEGPDRRNGTGYDSYRHAADMVTAIEGIKTDPRPLFVYAALHVAHEPLEAPAELVAQYKKAQPGWCEKKATIAAMVTVADNVTAQIHNALVAQGVWDNTVLVFMTDNGGDSGCSSCHPLRGRKRSFFEGGVRVPSFVTSPLLPRTGRVDTGFFHCSDWYPTFLGLAGVTNNPRDSGPGRFAVDGVDVWPYLSDPNGATPFPPRSRDLIVLGYNYSTLKPGGGVYDAGSGALIEITTGYKLVMGSQKSAQDTLSWDPADYPCSTTAAGRDCIPHCLFNVLGDPEERVDLSVPGTGNSTDSQALARLLAAYKGIGSEEGMPNPIDVMWNEQGTPYDPGACKEAARTGYWGPWLQ